MATVKTFFSYSGLMALGYIVVLLTQMVISRELGTSVELDAYFYALSLVNLLFFFSAPVNEAAIPQFFAAKENGPHEASIYFSKVVNTILSLSIPY